MALFKKKYETIECSNDHIFRIDYNGVIKRWRCLVLENEVVGYEGERETARIPITNSERAPQVIQADTKIMIYGEELRFQLENGFPFLRLDGEWVGSDTFEKARRDAAAKMYRKNGWQQIAVGAAMLVFLLIYWLIKKDMGDLWILSVFGIFCMSSGAFTMVRVRNELMAFKEAEEAAAAEEEAGEEVDSIAAARALHAAKEE